MESSDHIENAECGVEVPKSAFRTPHLRVSRTPIDTVVALELALTLQLHFWGKEKDLEKIYFCDIFEV
ncbi:MAG: hypothetical protein ACK4WF_06185 [Candidatus Brocadiales bacterium]